MQKMIPLLAVLFVLTACNNNTQNQSAAVASAPPQTLCFDRLLGLWQNVESKSYERWSKNSDGTYRSVGFKIVAADTVYTERVDLRQVNGQWSSENSVVGQNEGKAIPFSVTKLSSDEVHFSNPKHDFPTDIHYRMSDDNTIEAYIVGPNSTGSFDTIPFNFKRVL